MFFWCQIQAQTVFNKPSHLCLHGHCLLPIRAENHKIIGIADHTGQLLITIQRIKIPVHISQYNVGKQGRYRCPLGEPLFWFDFWLFRVFIWSFEGHVNCMQQLTVADSGGPQASSYKAMTDRVKKEWISPQIT